MTLSVSLGILLVVGAIFDEGTQVVRFLGYGDVASPFANLRCSVI